MKERKNSERMCAPVVVFCYKRLDKISNCLSSLQRCVLAEDTSVVVYSDGFRGDEDKKKVNDVRDYLHALKQSNRFREFEVIEQSSNRGLASSIISGVTEVIKKSGKAIVLEDDLLVSADFLLYMNDGLDFYKDDKRYGCISAYTQNLHSLANYDKDIYVVRKGECWGWATWIDRWDDVDWELSDFEKYLKNYDKRKQFASLEMGLEEQLIAQHEGNLDAWAARWMFHLFQNGMLTVYPSKCRAINDGIDGSGEHCCEVKYFDNKLADTLEPCKFEFLDVNPAMERDISNFGKESFGSRIISRMGKLLKWKG